YEVEDRASLIKYRETRKQKKVLVPIQDRIEKSPLYRHSSRSTSDSAVKNIEASAQQDRPARSQQMPRGKEDGADATEKDPHKRNGIGGDLQPNTEILHRLHHAQHPPRPDLRPQQNRGLLQLGSRFVVCAPFNFSCRFSI